MANIQQMITDTLATEATALAEALNSGVTLRERHTMVVEKVSLRAVNHTTAGDSEGDPRRSLLISLQGSSVGKSKLTSATIVFLPETDLPEARLSEDSGHMMLFFNVAEQPFVLEQLRQNGRHLVFERDLDRTHAYFESRL